MLLIALAVGWGSPVGAQEAEGAAGSPCERFAAATVAGTVAEPSLIEISGVAASRAHPGVLWAHNDSGGEPAVSALSGTGADLGTYAVPGATATDWEDIAAGPGPDPGRSYLYVADIGDNGEARDSVSVHRVPEPDEAPDGGDGRFAEDEVLTLRYPGGPVDAEALLVDPRSGDLVVVGKRATAAPVFAASADALGEGGDVTLRQVATLGAAPAGAPPGPLGLVTGGDVSPDGSVVLLRTYLSVAAYARPDGEPIEAAFTSTPCAAPQVSEPQGEALGFLADGSAYVTISEGSAPPVNRFAVAPALSATTTSTTAPPPDEAADEEDDDGGGGVSVGVVEVAVAAALLLAIGGGLVWALRRRRR